MPYHGHLKRRAFPHAVKRLNCQHGGQIKMSDLPRSIIDENLPETKPSNYIKFFDYPLAELLADHSTDPMQNTARQFVVPLPPSDIGTSDGRFANHEMIMRKNGETTILHAKQDLALTNGFAPVMTPAPVVSQYRSAPASHQPSSNSILNKMSLPKSTHPPTIKRKCKRNHKKSFQPPPQHFSNNFDYSETNNQPDLSLVHLVRQALHDIMEEKNNYHPQPLPLMSVPTQFHGGLPPCFPNDYCNFSTQSQLENPRVEPFDQWSLFNEQSSSKNSISMHNYGEFSYDLPLGDYCNFSQNRGGLPQNSYFDPPSQEENNSFKNSASGFFYR